MSDPNIIIETPVYHVNLTILLSIIAVALTAMGTLVAIFRKKPRPEEMPGTSQFCIQNKTDFARIESTTQDNNNKLEKNREENNKKFEELKGLINDTSKGLEILKVKSDNTTKGFDEMKQDVKEVANKLDDLLKQLLDWMSD